jgi:ubiquinone/menaquinone biosynthesis C-methylase UbiE
MLNNPIRRLLSPPDRLISKLRISSNDVVVDFGCGPGFFTIPIARVARRAIGVDVSQEMLRRTANYAKKSRVSVETIESDGNKIDLPDATVDLCLLVHVYHEVANKSKLLDEFLRILKPSGKLDIVERTKGGLFAEKLGPPTVNIDGFKQGIDNAGFITVEIAPYEKDSIFYARKNSLR